MAPNAAPSTTVAVLGGEPLPVADVRVTILPKFVEHRVEQPLEIGLILR